MNDFFAHLTVKVEQGFSGAYVTIMDVDGDYIIECPNISFYLRDLVEDWKPLLKDMSRPAPRITAEKLHLVEHYEPVVRIKIGPGTEDESKNYANLITPLLRQQIFYDYEIEHADTNKLKQWCYDNLDGGWYLTELPIRDDYDFFSSRMGVITPTYLLTFNFANKDDLLLFQLRWEE